MSRLLGTDIIVMNSRSQVLANVVSVDTDEQWVLVRSAGEPLHSTPSKIALDAQRTGHPGPREHHSVKDRKTGKVLFEGPLELRVV
jgi:hypothetical protein